MLEIDRFQKIIYVYFLNMILIYEVSEEAK